MSSLPNDNFDPVRFYMFASQLYTQNTDSDETAYRTIIGRAYYAVHLCAKEYADITSSSGSIHNTVILHFQASNKQIYNQIRDLKELRTKADYELNLKISKREAGESLRLAKEILTTLNYLN